MQVCLKQISTHFVSMEYQSESMVSYQLFPDSKPIAFSNYPQTGICPQALCFRFVFILKKDIEAIIQIPSTQSVLDTVKHCAEFEEKLALICPMLKWKGVLYIYLMN